MDENIEKKLKQHADRILEIDTKELEELEDEISEIEGISLDEDESDSKLLKNKNFHDIDEMDVEKIISETVEIQRKFDDLEKTKIERALDSKEVKDSKKRSEIKSKLNRNVNQDKFKNLKMIDPDLSTDVGSESYDDIGSEISKKPIDGKFKIEISQDEMLVQMTLSPPLNNGKPISVDSIMKKLGIMGVEFAIKKKEIEKCVKFVNSKKEKFYNLVISEGILPENGKNGKVKFVSEFIDAADFNIKLDEINGKVCNIKNGDLLISFEEPTLGIQGTNVFGKKIPAKDGSGTIITGDNVIEQKRGGVIYYHALVGGIAHFENNKIQVIENTNSSFDIIVSVDKMQAYLDIIPGTGYGRNINIEDVFEEISNKKIHLNLNVDQIKEKINLVNSGDVVDQVQVQISQGKQPVNGENGKITFHVRVETEKGFVEDETGRIDYRIKDNVINIDKENKLFTIYPPLKAVKNGLDVFNNTIMAVDGNPIKIEIGENIRELDVKKCKVYHSLIDGRLFYDKVKSFINVRKVMTVNNVDLDSGNIEFNGDLFVRGDIADNMIIKLEGDLFVKGNITAANIFVKGDIKCEGGVVTKNKGEVICKGDFFAKFIENSIVNCQGDIHVFNAILNSEVKSNKSIVVKGEKGFIIGGSVHAKNAIKAISIGSSHGNKTDIYLGSDFVIHNNYLKISAKRFKIEDKYKKTTELIKKLFKLKNDVSSFTDDMKNIYKKSLVVQVQLKEKIIELKSIEVKLLAELNDNVRSELIVDDKLYSDVTVSFGEKSFIVKNDEIHISYVREKGSEDIQKKILM